MKLYVATPTHYEMHNPTHDSLMRLRNSPPAGLTHIDFSAPVGDSLIQRFRDKCADMFLRTDYTHMLFVDSDIVFAPEDVSLLLHSGHQLVGGIYAKKRINWQEVYAAVQRGVPANELEYYAADAVVLYEPGQIECRNACIPVRSVGTGFCLIAREVFDAIRAHENNPELWYRVGYEDKDDAEQYHYFSTQVVKHGLNSEDWDFCRRAKAAGVQSYAHLSVKLGHIGQHCYWCDTRTLFKETAA